MNDNYRQILNFDNDRSSLLEKVDMLPIVLDALEIQGYFYYIPEHVYGKCDTMTMTYPRYESVFNKCKDILRALDNARVLGQALDNLKNRVDVKNGIADPALEADIPSQHEPLNIPEVELSYDFDVEDKFSDILNLDREPSVERCSELLPLVLETLGINPNNLDADLIISRCIGSLREAERYDSIAGHQNPSSKTVLFTNCRNIIQVLRRENLLQEKLDEISDLEKNAAIRGIPSAFNSALADVSDEDLRIYQDDTMNNNSHPMSNEEISASQDLINSIGEFSGVEQYPLDFDYEFRNYPILREHSDEKFNYKPFIREDANDNRGVDVFKPRPRNIGESDADYEAYLRAYYAALEKYAKGKFVLALPAGLRNDVPLLNDGNVESQTNIVAISKPIDLIPTKPEVVPTKPEVVPTKPEVIPTKPEVIPTKPEVIPTKPEVDPINLHGNDEIQTYRGWDQVLADIFSDGVAENRGDDFKYRASQIRVTSGFRKKLNSGNYLYNLVASLGVGTFIQIPVSLIMKLRGRITTSDEDQKRIDNLKERIDNLPDSDLEIIINELRGGTAGREINIPLVRTMLGERISRYLNEKVSGINQELESLINDVISDFNRIVECVQTIDAGVTPEEENRLRNEIASKYAGKSSVIKRIADLRIEGNKLISGGSLQSFIEDMRAGNSKMSLIGKRFAKNDDAETELFSVKSSINSQMMNAARSGDDRTALLSFVQQEKLLSNNHVIENSIFGKRSTGAIMYNPLVQSMDYSRDPFITDLFGAIATVGGIVSIAGQISNIMKANAAVKTQNVQVADNQQTVNNLGKQIENESGIVFEGQQKQIIQDNLGYSNTAERYTLDANSWGIGTSAYSKMDDAIHAAYNKAYANAENGISNIVNNYQSGALSIADAMKGITGVAQQQQNEFVVMLQNYQSVLQNYAVSHPQFDLRNIQADIDSILSNPGVLNDMYQANASIAKIGQDLQNLSFSGMSNIAISIWPQILGTASAYLQSAQIANTMKIGLKNGRYGTEIINMLNQINNEEIETVRTF